MTPRMRDALTEARKGPLRRVHDDTPGGPAWPAHPATLAALVRCGLLEHGERRDKRARKVQEWTITEAGKAALEPSTASLRADRSRYLGGAGRANRYRTLPNGRQVVVERDDAEDTDADLGYTTSPQRAIDDLEVVDSSRFGHDVNLAYAQANAERHVRDLQRRARTLRRRLAEGAFRTEHQRRQVAARLADVEAELRAAMVVGRLAA